MKGYRIKSFLRSLSLLTWLVVAALTLTHCGKYNFSTQSGGNNNPFSNGLGNPNPNDLTCTTDTFTQPQPTTTRPPVDILFVVHPTASFQSVRDKVVQGLSNFLNNLPGIDYTVAVLPADVTTNPVSGQLYATSTYLQSHNNSPVIPSSLGTAQVIQDFQSFMDSIPDNTTYHNEDGLGALAMLLDSQNLPVAQQQGFFRKGAALAVVFVANEADLCGLPSTDPGTDSDYASEIQEAQSVCHDSAGNPVNPSTVFQSLNGALNLANVNLLTVGSVVYTNMNQQDVNGAEAEYGWGYIDITKLANGMSIDINGDIPGGLASIGQQVNTKLNLITDFKPTMANLDPATITVDVDGTSNVPFTYHPSTDVVHIDPNTAGKAGSLVKVNYCQLPAGAGNPNPNACYGTLCN